MRRRAAITVAAVLTAAVTAPAASAAPATITATALNTFDAPTYVHDGGTVASLTVTGGTHNATSTALGPDGNPLFASETISSGTTPVEGTQYLTTGSYPFVCTIHPGTMQAALNVPGSGLSRPSVALKVKSTDLDRVVSKDTLKVRVSVSGSEQAEVIVKLGSKKLTPREGVLGSRTVPFALTNKGEKILGNRSKATVTAEAAVPFGSPATAKGKLR